MSRVVRVDLGLVTPEWEPLRRLLHTILIRVRAELGDPAPVSLSVSTVSTYGVLRLATLGDGAGLVEAQAERFGGPIPDALATGVPVLVTDLWADPRWPKLTLAAVTELLPDQAAVWARVQGMAVLPVGHLEQSTIVLSAALVKPADEDTLDVLSRYKQLVESAIAVIHATAADGPDEVLRLLTGRAIIEQAKGAIVAATGTSSARAWRVLREASQNHNVKLRDLAVALIEYLGQQPAEQPVGLPAPVADNHARAVAQALWEQLAAGPAFGQSGG